MFDVVTCAQKVILRSLEEALAIVQQQTGISARQVRNIHNKAKDRGWHPGAPLTSAYLVDKLRSGRPVRVTKRVEIGVVNAVTNDRYGREKTLRQLVAQFNISTQSVHRNLTKDNFRKTKPTRKPELTADMRSARYLFALQHRHWTLEDWKSVIWSEKTSVVLVHRRGGYRVWTRHNEACGKSWVRET